VLFKVRKRVPSWRCGITERASSVCRQSDSRIRGTSSWPCQQITCAGDHRFRCKFAELSQISGSHAVL